MAAQGTGGRQCGSRRSSCLAVRPRVPRPSGASSPTSSDFDGRPAILRCIPPKAREELPPQLGVCCLPTGIQRKPYHHRSLNKYYEQYNIILTDSTGRKTYGYCCTFYDVLR